jgi:hypothetical protein
MGRNRDDDDDARSEEATRYRLAAEEAVGQLDWVVNYLYRIRKDSIARVLDKNRSVIRRDLSRIAD